MIDISLCDGLGCKIKDTCLRYIEHSKLDGYAQAWYIAPKFNILTCENYINIKER